METLRGQGFRFALDDLGSEYSTLSAMSDLPFDTVKLDRLLVKRFADDSMSRSIVEGIARACEKTASAAWRRVWNFPPTSSRWFPWDVVMDRATVLPVR